MNSVFKITPQVNRKIEKYKDDAIREICEFFNIEWIYTLPKIFIVDDRKTIDMLRDKKTGSELVGWHWGPRAVFILNPKNISKESSHTGLYDVEKLIIHELTHSCFELIFGKSNFLWITEGVALYVAGQFDENDNPSFEGFLDDKNVYYESGLAINLLVDTFGKDKLFEFL